MAVRTGKCILAKDIRLDREYKNILNYSESQMVTLVQSKAVYSATNCSFIREGSNELKLDVAYGTAIQANYLAFQNPDYSNKWFFAFIDSVDYISNGVTKITFTIDECATWFDYWTVQPCFVIREHVNLDTVGLNTVPEDLEHGEYILNTQTTDDMLDDICYIVQATEPYGDDSNATRAWFCGGIANAGVAYYAKYSTDITIANPLLYVIDLFADAGKLDKITNVYVVPQKLLGLTAQSASWDRTWGNMAPVTYTLSIAKQTTINGYAPHNNKLLTKEYNCLVVDNNNGSANTYAYEDFLGNDCQFEVSGVPSCGCSIKIVPKSYKGASKFEQEGLVGGKYPTCGWINDQYTNWLTQQSVNLQNGLISSVAGVAIGAGMIATGVGAGAGGYLIGSSIGTGVAGIAGHMVQKFQHQIMPATAEGNINSGDVLTSARKNKFHFLRMSIKLEYAVQIDRFFDRFGYKVNLLKVPNQTGRTYWNFVQIGEGEEIGEPTATISVPTKSMDIINNAYRKGVTIWHDHANIGNYALTNSIVSS